MRILFAKLTGYVGIYNGLGKTELFIDFSKSINHICVISGANGCGKSTLLNALSVLPDGNECFVPSMNAEKMLRIIDNDIVYDIDIKHPIDNHNNRTTTKAYIQKNGVELNENGNVSSYKDIIFNEFDLDNNFITLSHLSSDDRGLADKKPAERKKFISSISSTLDVYNQIHKNLNKKSNIYKSYINNLTGKIRMIGDESSLRSALYSLNNRQKRLTEEIEKLKADIIQNNTILAVNDPDGQLQQHFNDVEAALYEAKTKSENEFVNLTEIAKSIFGADTHDYSNIEIDIQNIKDQIQTHKDNNVKNNADLIVVSNNIKSISDRISSNQIKIDKFNGEINLELDKQLQRYGARISYIEDEFKSIGITNFEDISKSEIDSIIDILHEFISAVDSLYEYTDINGINKLIELYSQGKSISMAVSQLNETIAQNANDKVELSGKLVEYNNDFNILKELDNRPKECKIDKCYFLKRPNEILNKYGSKESLQDEIKSTEFNISRIDNDNRSMSKTIDYLKSLAAGESILDKIRALINSNKAILSKFSISKRISNLESVLNDLASNNLFNDIRDLSILINTSNDIIEYRSISKIYQSLLSEQKINQSNIKALKELQSESDKLSVELEDNKLKRNSILKDIEFTQGIITNLESKQSTLENFSDHLNIYKDLQTTYESYKKEYEDLQQQFKGSGVIIQKISEDQTKINQLQSELDPINDQKKNIDSQIMLLDTYNKEYQEYSEKYGIIDKLKKYSSPGAGIQVLYMNMYMSQTLDLANQLLGMIFQGQYHLMDYVINENEFRMPFIGNGLAVDDISSGSTSQVCIMGMIVNLALLHQASTKYNITRLDEIDSGLDHANRYMFVDVLQRIIQILNIDQLFIISHSAESALSNVDVIQLSPIPDYEDVFTGANIIYTYKER